MCNSGFARTRLLVAVAVIVFAASYVLGASSVQGCIPLAVDSVYKTGGSDPKCYKMKGQHARRLYSTADTDEGTLVDDSGTVDRERWDTCDPECPNNLPTWQPQAG
jgi:hypothetical protein